jgi:CubicO group peptidase (beta-lactamase class C family)
MYNSNMMTDVTLRRLVMIKKILIILVYIIWFLFLSLPGTASEGFGEKANKINQLMQKSKEYRLFTGSVLVAKQGHVIYQKSFGPADRGWDIPNRVNTKYKIGSITKQFTAMLVLQLVQEGKIRLDGKVSHYLDYYPKDKGDRITVHHLLCHTGGIPNLARYYKDWFSVRWLKEYSTRSFIKLFSDLDLEFEPGSRWSYSNAGYYILAAIIENITGKSYAKAMGERIFQPLAMKDSGYFDGYTIVPRLATGYEYWNFHFSNTGYNSATTHKGNGGLYSTVSDLMKWDRALYTSKLLSNQYRNLMFQPQMNLRPGADYAYGWVIKEKFLGEPGKKIHFCEHFGSDLGFNNVITRIFQEQYLIVLLSNTSQSDIPLLRDQIINILYNQPFFCPKPLSLVLDSCKNESEVQKTFRDYKEQDHKFSIKQDRINGVGFKFVRAKKYTLGLAILDFNASQFPRSPFVYESLGEAYMMAGNKPMALKNFKKLLELDPRNSDAKKRINELEKL